MRQNVEQIKKVVSLKNEKKNYKNKILKGELIEIFKLPKTMFRFNFGRHFF